MKKAMIIIAAIIVIVVGGGLAAVYFMLDKIIHTGIEIIGPEATGVSVTVDKVHISPLAGTFGLTAFTMGNPPGFTADKSLSFRNFQVTIDTASVLKEVIIIEEVIIDGVSMTWEGLAGNNHRQIMKNIDAYAARFKKPDGGGPPVASSEEPGKKVIIKNVILRDSSLDFVATGKKLATIPLPDLHLTDVGEKEGGATAAEAIKQTYEQIFAAMARSVGTNMKLFREKLGELGQQGQELLDRTRESAAGIRDDAAKKLDEVKRSLGDLFR